MLGRRFSAARRKRSLQCTSTRRSVQHSAFTSAGPKKNAPLTHDLLSNVLTALGGKVERVVINDFKNGVYFGRLIISAENELHQHKIMEIDARSSDCMAMAALQKAPIYVSHVVWDEVEDMRPLLERLQNPEKEEPSSE